jgi:anti-sigma factor RsiW
MAYRGVSENDLHAFVDGQLAPERRRELETHLAAHPGAAERVRAFVGQREALAALRDSLARGRTEAPRTDIGRALGRVVRWQRRIGRRRRRAQRTIVAVGTGGAGRHLGFTT